MGTADQARSAALSAADGGGMGRRLAVLMALLAVLLAAEPTLAQGTLCPSRPGPLPSYGGARPGPAAVVPPAPTGGVAAVDPVEPAAAPVVVETGVSSGPVAPVALRIPAVGVDAGIEQLGQVDGVMQNPSGPWVVAWYPYLGSPGLPGNTVMAGHIDYAGVGPAIFAGVGGLWPGAEIVVVGADGQLLLYSVAWVASYDVADLSAADLDPIIGPTADESLTLITCGGVFDEATASYLSRTVVRATRIGSLTFAPAAPTAQLASGDWRFQPGATAEVADDAVGLAFSPATGSDVVVDLAQGTTVAVTGGSIAADGYVWWPVRDATGRQGFIAGPDLACGSGVFPHNQARGQPGDGTGGSDRGAPPNDGTAGPAHGAPVEDGTAGPNGGAPTTADRPDPPT